MMRRWLPHPALTLSLALLWLLLNNTLAPGHILLGLGLGWMIPLLIAPFVLDVPKVRRPLKLIGFLARVLVDIVVANLQVARLVLGPRARLSPAFVQVPVRIEDEFVLTMLTSIISLTPGTVSACLSEDRRTLLVHALDAPDLDALVRQIQARYEAPLMEIFQCSAT